MTRVNLALGTPRTSTNSILLCLCLLILGLGFCLHSSFAAEWQVKWEAKELPHKVEEDEWNLAGKEQFCQLEKDDGMDVLHINDTSSAGGDLVFFIRESDGKSGTVEALVKVLKCTDGWAAALGIEDGKQSAVLHLFPEYVQLWDKKAEFKVDMMQYHVVRVTKDKTKVKIYLDDKLAIEEDSMPRDCPQCLRFFFGASSSAGEGESFWNYVYYTEEGAFSPDELHSTLYEVSLYDRLAVIWGRIKSNS